MITHLVELHKWYLITNKSVKKGEINGGVLIAILILTLFAYLFGQMAENTSNIYNTIEQSEIAEFNQKFINYEGRGIGELSDKPLTVQDVATLINLAQDNNKNPKFPTTIEIRNRDINIAETKNYIEWLKENQTSDKKFNCREVHINPETLLVDYVLIEQHS